VLEAVTKRTHFIRVPATESLEKCVNKVSVTTLTESTIKILTENLILLKEEKETSNGNHIKKGSMRRKTLLDKYFNFYDITLLRIPVEGGALILSASKQVETNKKEKNLSSKTCKLLIIQFHNTLLFFYWCAKQWCNLLQLCLVCHLSVCCHHFSAHFFHFEGYIFDTSALAVIIGCNWPKWHCSCFIPLLSCQSSQKITLPLKIWRQQHKWQPIIKLPYNRKKKNMPKPDVHIERKSLLKTTFLQNWQMIFWSLKC